MPFNKSELYRACMEVAEETLWDHQNPPSHDRIKGLADKFFQYAEQLSEVGEDLAPGENPIVHAVRYLAYTHAIPPMGEDTRWFRESLEVLMELCCPNTIHTSDSVKFFNLLEQGIRSSMADIAVGVDQEEKARIDGLLDQIDPNLKTSVSVLGRRFVLITLIV